MNGRIKEYPRGSGKGSKAAKTAFKHATDKAFFERFSEVYRQKRNEDDTDFVETEEDLMKRIAKAKAVSSYNRLAIHGISSFLTLLYI